MVAMMIRRPTHRRTDHDRRPRRQDDASQRATQQPNRVRTRRPKDRFAVKISISITGRPRLTAAHSTLLANASVFAVGQASGVTATTAIWLAVATTSSHLLAFLAGTRA
jgi:hypothetical protein